jgi:putative toxin-antitoxin system antitoxin component (TIGR02293 family)
MSEAEIRGVYHGRQPMLSDVLASAFEAIVMKGEKLSEGMICELARRMKMPSKGLSPLPLVARGTKELKVTLVPAMEESDRLLQMAEVINCCMEIFGDAAKASKWFKSPCLAFRGAVPLSLLETFSGVEMILNELERIEHEAFIAGIVF